MLIIKFSFLPDNRRFIFYYILIIYDVSCWICIASNGTMINKYRAGKDIERKLSYPDLMQNSEICFEEQENHENFQTL